MKYLVHILRSETICVMMKKELVLYPPSQIDKSRLQTSVPRSASTHSQGIDEGALHRLRSFHRAGRSVAYTSSAAIESTPLARGPGKKGGGIGTS